MPKAVRWLSAQHGELWSVPAGDHRDGAASFPAGCDRSWPGPRRRAGAVSAPDAAGYGRIGWLLQKYAGLSPIGPTAN